MIDYLRVRFPTIDALAIIRDVLQLKADYMLLEDYGQYGYESQYVLGDISIVCSTKTKKGRERSYAACKNTTKGKNLGDKVQLRKMHWKAFAGQSVFIRNKLCFQDFSSF